VSSAQGSLSFVNDMQLKHCHHFDINAVNFSYFAVVIMALKLANLQA